MAQQDAIKLLYRTGLSMKYKDKLATLIKSKPNRY
jgi:hypothetical protein